MVKAQQIAIATTTVIGALVVGNYYLKGRKTIIEKRTSDAVVPKVAIPGKKGKLNREFFLELWSLIRIVLPRIMCKETLLLFLHTTALAIRTILSIQVANLDGQIVKTIVDRKKSLFVKKLLQWLLLAIPATYTNSMIRYLESKLAIAFRTKLTMHLYGLYMDQDTYYRVETLDSRLANADQCLTEDVSRFCLSLAHLHSQVSKPLLDVVLMSAKLIALNANIQENTRNRVTTVVGPVLLAGLTIYVTAKALQLISPPFGRLVAEQAQLEGEFRFAHSRLITNAEEIAFYDGHRIEKAYLKDAYLRLVKHMNRIFKLRIFYNMAEGFLMKYFWSAVGLTMVAIPGFTNTKASVSARTQDFIIARGLLISAADAVERIMSSYKELTELAGYTYRVTHMIHVFQQVHDGVYQKNMIASGDEPEKPRRKVGQGSLLAHPDQSGQVIEGERIEFDGVPIVSPNGDILVESLSFVAEPGMHFLITGPNGCGKSSMFRILGGLWPTARGRLVKPTKSGLCYIPQRPYLSVGCLREQVIYPHTREDFFGSGRTDRDLEDIMEWVHLTYLVDREGGWDALNDWQDVLSGGEKQRIGMARIFYHRPKYAILDECTSAVSIDVEGSMYMKAKELGITLMTVTHRPSLWKYHDYLLKFDGEGGWTFERLSGSNMSTVMTNFQEEKSQLESQLMGVPKMQARLKELCGLLGQSSTVPLESIENGFDGKSSE